MKIEKLLITIAFHYAEERLENLSKVVSQFKYLADNVTAVIITNSSDEIHRKQLCDIFENNVEVFVFVPDPLFHPYLLTWCHVGVFKNRFKEDPTITHFMYLEDDMLIQPHNIDYWLKGREELRNYGLIPAFCRYELRPNSDEKYHVDNIHTKNFVNLRRLSISDEYAYINLPNPYHAMYLMDRELIEEHLFKTDNNILAGSMYTGVREQAAAGLVFTNVPENFESRYVIGFDITNKKIDSGSWIHHTTNNYTNHNDTPFGKIKADNLIS